MKIRPKTAKHTCFIAHGLKEAWESINYIGKMMAFCLLCRVGIYGQKDIEIEIKINMFVNKLGSEFRFISFSVVSLTKIENSCHKIFKTAHK